MALCLRNITESCGYKTGVREDSGWNMVSNLSTWQSLLPCRRCVRALHNVYEPSVRSRRPSRGSYVAELLLVTYVGNWSLRKAALI